MVVAYNMASRIVPDREQPARLCRIPGEEKFSSGVIHEPAVVLIL